MLFPAQVAQFADSRCQLIFTGHELRVEGLALRRQQVLVVGIGQQTVKLSVEERIPVVAGAVTAIVADVERLVAFRRFCQFYLAELVRIIVAIGPSWVGFQRVEHLGTNR